ncbi:MAG: BMP family ABC transporter substrate-binding protein [Clostridia bacterium]|nr:BMP family ABC transporter substrate-binding protein [Clostridia bacterium]
MDMRAYIKARREGLQAYNAAIRENSNPYLPVLEENVPNLASLTRVSLGIRTIPLDKVSGTVAKGRSYAFACNFMPILESDTEFSSKWAYLYESVEENGVNESVKCLEYLGYYYLQEGNKRVSVMKAMDAGYIEADVVRVLPEKTGDPLIAAYYEYVDFSKESGIYDILFSVPGSYAKLTAMPGVRPKNRWTEDDTYYLEKLYRFFAKAYNTVSKDRSFMAQGDAFLRYLLVFGYLNVRDDDDEKTLERVRLMAAEFELRDDSVSLIMDSRQNVSAPSLIGSLFRPSRIRAAFLLNRDPSVSAWNYWQDIGRIAVQEKLGSSVETKSCIVTSRTEFTEAIEQLIADGYTAIFATNPVMLNSCIQPSLEHPDVQILCCSQLSSYQHIRTYYPRFYEAKFLMGIAAGILTDNGKIGYVADFPIYGTPASANAFAMGARMVAPNAKIYLDFYSRKGFDPSKPFEDPEIRVICDRDINAPSAGSRDYGLYIRENGETRNMATMIPRWDNFYSAILERMLNGTFNAADTRGGMQNLWWGMSSGAIDIAFSNRFDPHSARLIRMFQDELRQASFTPFEGELKDQSGVIRCEADRRLTPAEVLCMDYLLDNIVGFIPAMEDLADTAVPLARLQSITGTGELKPVLSTISWNRK